MRKIDLCGEEVTGDYPHEEVQHPGVNHFPDGVFQKCRIIIQREKDAERERLRKVRRMKNNSNKQNPSPLMSPSGSVKKTAILPAEGLEWDDAYINAELALPVASPVVLRNNGSGLQTPYAQASPATPSRIVISGLLDQFDQFDQEWDLALAHVDTMASPARRTNTPNNNPNPNASYNNLRTALTQNQGNNNFSPNSYLPANGSPVNPLIATGRTFSSNASNGGGSSLQQRYAATSLQNSISSVQAVNTTGTSTPNFNNANVGIAGRNMNTNNNLSSAALNAMPGPGGTSSRQGSPQRFTRHSSANVIPTPSNTR